MIIYVAGDFPTDVLVPRVLISYYGQQPQHKRMKDIRAREAARATKPKRRERA